MVDKKQHTLEAYYNSLSPTAREVLGQLRKIIRGAIPAEGITEVISYGIPALKLHGKSLVYLAGWKDHVSLYPVPVGDEAFQQLIAPYRTGKGTLSFPLDKPLPSELITQVVSLLVAGYQERSGYAKQ